MLDSTNSTNLIYTVFYSVNFRLIFQIILVANLKDSLYLDYHFKTVSSVPTLTMGVASQNRIKSRG